MPLSIWLAAAAIACALPIAWWAVSAGAGAKTERIRSNLAAGMEYMTDMRRVVLQQSAQDRVVRPAWTALARRARRITPAGMIDSLERRINLAGMSDAWPVDRLLAMKLLLGIGGTLFGAMLFIANPSFVRVLLLLLIAGISFMLPDAWIGHRADARQQEIERALADALDQITVCVESGLSFEAAVARVADGGGPLADELTRLLQDIQIGIPRARALENLLARTDVADLRGFVHSFTHAERYGIPIAQVLRTQANEMREKRRQRAEERAMKIPVKLTFPLVLCILPALFVVVAGPGVIRISHAFGL
jgi:tight adherence protein C